MSGRLPPGRQQFFDVNGDPLASGRVYFYIPSTTTPKDTYQDAALSSLNTNPVILDASGSAVIYGVGSYRQILKDSLLNTIWDTTVEAPAFLYRGTWATATDYNVGDAVTDGAAGANTLQVYICQTANTSGVWATDLAAGKWGLSGTVASVTAQALAASSSASQAGTYATNAATSASNAQNSSSSANTSATNAAASAVQAAASALTASNASTTTAASASAAATSASNAATSASAASTSQTAAAASAAAAASSASAASTSETNASNSASSASASASTATTQASNAATSASNASTSASNAATSASTASTQATNASASATSASASATLASTYAAALQGTSTTSNTIGVGALTFTTQAGKQFAAGQYMLIVDSANSANYVHGQVTSYSGTTLVFDSQSVGGSGTKTSWNIYLSGTRGATGAAGASGSVPIAAAGGTADAITATYTPPNGSLTNMLTLMFVAASANVTTTPSFAPDGLTARTIVKRGGLPLAPADIPGAGFVALVEYNLANTRWELLNPATVQEPWVAAGGTADAITATYSPALTAVYDGLRVHFRASAANATTTPTFAPNGLTARTIVKKGGAALLAGDIPAALAECTLIYNAASTRWELENPYQTPMSGDATITSAGVITVTQLNGTPYLARLHATALSF